MPTGVPGAASAIKPVTAVIRPARQDGTRTPRPRRITRLPGPAGRLRPGRRPAGRAPAASRVDTTRAAERYDNAGYDTAQYDTGPGGQLYDTGPSAVMDDQSLPGAHDFIPERDDDPALTDSDVFPRIRDDIPPETPRKAGKPHTAAKSRSKQSRSKRGDDDDWPSTEWDKLSDEQYWAELSADKPLATTARAAQPVAAKAAPAPRHPVPGKARPGPARRREAVPPGPTATCTTRAGVGQAHAGPGVRRATTPGQAAGGRHRGAPGQRPPAADCPSPGAFIGAGSRRAQPGRAHQPGECARGAAAGVGPPR